MNIPTTTEITNIVLAASLVCAWVTIILQGVSIRMLRKSLRVTDEAVLQLLKKNALEALGAMILSGSKSCADRKKLEAVNEEKRYDMSELNKLEEYLKANEYEYCRRPLNGGEQIIVNKNTKQWFDAVIHSFSYGHEKGLLEIQGLLTDDERKIDLVKGYMTANDIIKRIEDLKGDDR